MANRGGKKQGALPGTPTKHKVQSGRTVVGTKRAITIYVEKDDPLLAFLTPAFDKGKGSQMILSALYRAFGLVDPFSLPPLVLEQEQPRLSAATFMQAKRPVKNTAPPPEPEPVSSPEDDLKAATGMFMNMFG